ASLENTENNLVLVAAKALAGHARLRSGAEICLTKNLPVAAGIGSGSADAAAVMKALAALWEIPWDEAVMGALAGNLGADVPVCLMARATFIGGIGELLDAAPTLPECGLLLVNPGVQLATPSVFLARAGKFGQAARFDGPPADAASLATLLAARRNDLTQAALQLAPVIGKVLEAMDAEGAHLARMSGSGATCFGLFDDPEVAEVVGERLRHNHPGWWVAAGSWADT
ncbi:MAG: 4-(cytidine 5'-diphospho)-2-C-methyl-D-erythritol kinase, partial [Pseudomonadota bacterium]|nr:4-(cytidine 5'-diphospho)-2-C-methyl-D-erythritol kinase [Pseudomonadota bacterium]